MKVDIGSREISKNSPIYIVAEAGTTSNGEISTALELIESAKTAGCDAIKFMMINADEFMSDKSVVYDYDWFGGRYSENMYEMFKSLEYTEEEWLLIKDKCDEVGIDLFVTIDFLDGVDWAEKLTLSCAYKLSSWDANNLPLVRKMAATGKTIILDLGPVNLEELSRLITIIEAEGNSNIILLHCTHASDVEQVNMKTISYLSDVFNYPVGFSADTRDQVTDIIAVSLGAKVIEKRLTLDLKYKGHHHIYALEPNELNDYVEIIRRSEKLMGNRGIFPSKDDIERKDKYFVSLVAKKDISKGEIITREHLACKRPGTGIDPAMEEVLLGKVALNDIAENRLISWEDF